MAFLIMNRESDSARERLIELFWPNGDPDSARKSLNTALHSIRRCIRAAGVDPASCLNATNAVIRWTADTTVDAQTFAALAARDEPAALQEALRAYNGDFLEGDYDEWSVTERERFARLYEGVLSTAVVVARDPEVARRLVARNPYAEEAYAVLIDAELDAGRSAAANEWVKRCRQALAEVGEKPSEAFDERFAHIGSRSLDVPACKLPRQTTSFVGRQTALTEIEALLSRSQLVTIVGTGGVGKTRVALQVGTKSLDRSGAGVWFVDLAKVSEAESVIAEIAAAFDIKSQGFRALLDHVLVYLKHRRLLLILDNCEHVVAEAARVVEAIISTCPRLTVLATSREILGVRGEQIYRLPSLEVPAADAPVAPEDALAFEAVGLFVARASAADAGFALNAKTAPAIVEVCRQLDGIALAIELAAARVTTIGVQQLPRQLRDQFRIPKNHDRAAPPRHRTMRATLDWSYDLLPEPEKSMFRRLAIFQGGCTMEAIAETGPGGAPVADSVFDTVSSLVDKSLVTVEFLERSERFRLLEPVRQYGLERLRECDEFQACAHTHALHFTRFAQQAAANWLTIPELEWLENIEGEIDNIRAALTWTLSLANDALLGAELAAHLWAFWFSHHYHEGRRWLEAAQAAVDYRIRPELAILLALARARLYLPTNVGSMLSACEEALQPARCLNDQALLLRTLFYYGIALTITARFDEAAPILNEALLLAERSNDRYRTAFMLMFLAKMSRKSGDDDRARAYCTRFTKIYEEMNLPLERNRWILLLERAIMEQRDGRLDRAISLTAEAYEAVAVTKDFASAVYVEHSLGYYYLQAGDADRARGHGRSLVRLSQEELFPHATPAGLQVCAGVAMLRSSYVAAARLLGFAEARFDESPIPRDAYVEIDARWFSEPLLRHFGDAELARLMEEGAALPEDRAIGEALKV